MISRSRRGIALYVVVLFLCFAAVLSYSLEQLMVQQRALGVLSNQRLIARSVAHSIFSIVTAQINVVLSTPSSDLYKDFTGAPGFTRPADGTDITPLLDVATDIGQLLADVPGASGKATVTVSGWTSLSGASGAPAAASLSTFGLDPAEGRCALKIAVDSAYGAASMHWNLSKEMRFQNLSPGVLGKFTLWAQDVNPPDGNTVKSDFSGDPVAGPSDKLPLVLHNGLYPPGSELPSTDPATWEQRGFVYIGGSPVFNLTPGYGDTGELFTFLVSGTGIYPTGPDKTRIPAFEPTSLPAFFSVQYPPGPNPGSELAYSVLTAVYGYFDGQDADGRDLSYFFPGTGSTLTAGLHLYGDTSDPSATLVLGNVQRKYLLPAQVAVEVAEADGTSDGLDAMVCPLPSPRPTGPFPISSTATGLPDSAFDGQAIALHPTPLTLGTMFQPASTYDPLASQVLTEDYNQGYNFMYRTDDPVQLFRPPNAILAAGVHDQIQIPSIQGTGNLFDGLVSAITASPDDLQNGINTILQNRCIYHVATGADLLEEFTSQGGGGAVLNLGASVLVDSPEPVVDLGTVKIGPGGGGTIVLAAPDPTKRSSFALHGLTFIDATPVFGLVLCALNGDCAIDFPSDPTALPLNVSVIAPSGQLKGTTDPATPPNPVQMVGTLMVKMLDLLQLGQAGGNVYRDDHMDPTVQPAGFPATPATDGYTTLYRAYLSDDETSW